MALQRWWKLQLKMVGLIRKFRLAVCRMIGIENNPPQVSCLCITRNRVPLLKKTIQLFENQTYPNKELVIVYLSIDNATKDFLASLSNNNIKPVEVTYDPELTLGDLRNISIAEASGDYICTWDDDDWFHPERLRIQIQGVVDSGKKASVFLYILMLNNLTQEAYISSRWQWEASMLCNRRYILENNLVYPSVNKREDTYFVKKINSPEIMASLQNPKMYIYCYTGINTCNEAHFQKLFSYAKKLSTANAELIARIYNQDAPNNTLVTLLNNEILLPY